MQIIRWGWSLGTLAFGLAVVKGGTVDAAAGFAAFATPEQEQLSPQILNELRGLEDRRRAVGRL
jgi:hypothetical protein